MGNILLHKCRQIKIFCEFWNPIYNNFFFEFYTLYKTSNTYDFSLKNLKAYYLSFNNLSQTVHFFLNYKQLSTKINSQIKSIISTNHFKSSAQSNQKFLN